MNKKQSMQTFLILATVLTIGMIGTNHVFAGNSGYDKNDDHISWKKFKNSDTFQNADKDTRKCFEKAHDRGNNLAGYEVRKCEDDANSYSDNGNDNKYSNNNDNNDNKKGDSNNDNSHNNDNKKGDSNNGNNGDNEN